MTDDKPLNIWSNSDEEIGRRMSHFAHTPFELDGVIFGSVEAFYSWLLVENNDAKRAKIAPMWGARSKHACPKTKPDTIDYHGRKIKPSSPEHRELIVMANRAKLDAHPEIARRFVATLPRPIVHVLPGKEDEPHEVFCTIVRELRDEYAERLCNAATVPKQ